MTFHKNYYKTKKKNAENAFQPRGMSIILIESVANYSSWLFELKRNTIVFERLNTINSKHFTLTRSLISHNFSWYLALHAHSWNWFVLGCQFRRQFRLIIWHGECTYWFFSSHVRSALNSRWNKFYSMNIFASNRPIAVVVVAVCLSNIFYKLGKHYFSHGSNKDELEISKESQGQCRRISFILKRRKKKSSKKFKTLSPLMVM